MGTSNSAVFLQDTDAKAIAFEFQSRSTLDIAGGCQASASAEETAPGEGKEQVEEDPKFERLELSKMPIGGNKVDGEQGKAEGEEENDGFRTPTSPRHKIPVIRECPPAPKKPRSESLTKRKPGSDCYGVRSNLTEDMECLFRLISNGKIKKAKRVDVR